MKEGVTTGYCNVVMGQCAGYKLTTAGCNVIIGTNAGFEATQGHYNVYQGDSAGKCNQQGSANVFVGCYAGKGGSSPSSNSAGCNVAVGMNAGCGLVSGGDNTFIGAFAGKTTTTGNRNVAIGHNVQLPAAGCDAHLVIGCGSEYWLRGDSNFTVCDNKGPLRSIPERSVSSTSFVAADAGKVVAGTSTINIPASTMSAGDAVTIVNRSASAINVTRGSGLTMYFANDGTDADRVLAKRGMATVWFQSGTVAYISGAGLS